MHFYTRVAFKVSESSQFSGNKFYVVLRPVVVQKALHHQNKSLPRFQFHFFHKVFELWISDELTDMRTIEDTSFQLLNGQSWKSLAQVSEASIISVQSSDELFHEAKIDAHR